MARYLVILIFLLLSSVQARPLLIVAEEFPPASFIKEGSATGFDVDVAKAVFDRLGVTYEIQIIPWARAWSMLKSGNADVGLHVSYTDDRARYVHWPKNWVWMASFVFMTNEATKRAYDLKNYDDVKKSNLRIGIINENSYNPEFWAAFPSPDRIHQHYYKQLDPAPTAELNLKKLAVNHIQLFPIPQVLGVYMSEQLQLNGITHYDWTLFSKPYPNAFADHSTFSNEKYPDIQTLMQAYDAELARLKANPSEYQKFFQRHY